MPEGWVMWRRSRAIDVVRRGRSVADDDAVSAATSTTSTTDEDLWTAAHEATAERTGPGATGGSTADAGEVARLEKARDQRGELSPLRIGEERLDDGRNPDELINRRLPRLGVALVRLALIVLRRQIGEIPGDGGPDAVQRDGVRAVHGCEAVGLRTGEAEGVRLAE